MKREFAIGRESCCDLATGMCCPCFDGTKPQCIYYPSRPVELNYVQLSPDDPMVLQRLQSCVHRHPGDIKVTVEFEDCASGRKDE